MPKAEVSTMVHKRAKTAGVRLQKLQVVAGSSTLADNAKVAAKRKYAQVGV
jgi:hypothetical protein